MRLNGKDHFGYILENIKTKLFFLKTTILNWILILNVGTKNIIKSKCFYLNINTCFQSMHYYWLKNKIACEDMSYGNQCTIYTILFIFKYEFSPKSMLYINKYLILINAYTA